MKCNNCGKNISQPLELYDGRVVCSKCGQDFLASDKTFVLTEENQAYFNRGEELYYRWLENANHSVKYAQIEKAVALTRASAYMGNPNALARLGYYYDKDYAETNRGENMRTRLAYRCYRAVCMQEHAPKVEEWASEIDFTQLQQRTAKLLVEMMKNASDEVKKELAHDFEYVKTCLSARFGETVETSESDGKDTDEVKFALEHLSHLISPQRASVLGLLKITKETLEALTQTQKGETFNLLDIIRKPKAEIHLIKLDRNGGIRNSDDYFYRVSNEGLLRDIINDLSENETVALVYVNALGKHKFYANKLATLNKALVANDYSLARRLILDADRKRKDYALYDDDLYYCQNFMGANKNLTSALEKLIQTVCEGGTN